MIKTYLVSYTLHGVPRDYLMADKGVRSCGTAVKVMDTSWEVQSWLTLQQIEAIMRKHVDSNDTLYIREVVGIRIGGEPQPSLGLLGPNRLGSIASSIRDNSQRSTPQQKPSNALADYAPQAGISGNALLRSLLKRPQ